MRRLLMAMAVILAVLVATTIQSSAQRVIPPATATRSSVIEVYDANGQFLGTTLGFPQGKLVLDSPSPGSSMIATAPPIYIPTLKKHTYISLLNGMISNNIVGGSIGPFFFTTEDCSGGVAYALSMASYQIVVSPTIPQVFYIGTGQPQYLPMQSFSSAYPLPSAGDCNNGGSTPPPMYGVFVELTQVPSLPFSTPVALPLDYRTGGAN